MLTSNSLTFFGTQYRSHRHGQLGPLREWFGQFQNLSSFTTLPSSYFLQVNNGTDTLSIT